MTVDSARQLSLCVPPAPTPPASIDLRCCDVADLLAEVRGAALIVADPPWAYGNSPGVANPRTENIYAVLPDAEIVCHLDAAYDCAAPCARMVVWYTWPKDEEWRAAGGAGPRWGGRVSGGCWTKIAGVGVGYHWRGQCEPVALFTRGATGRPRELVLNEHRSSPTGHSEKPVEWLRTWVRAWTDPGDLVLDLYAGWAPLARACLAEGRRYVGAEIAAERHRQAQDRLALAGPTS